MIGHSAAGSNRLTVLAAEIQAAHTAIKRGTLAIAERALALGHALIEAKAVLPHGQWSEWLVNNTDVSERTARRYIQIARSGMIPATVADLGIKGAAASISRRAPVAADAQGFDDWQAELLRLIDEREAALPGFRAAFVDWARGQRAADRFADALRRDCTDQDLPALNALIEAQQVRALREVLSRRQVTPAVKS